MTDEEAVESAIPATRDQILKEYVDGSLAVKIIIDPKDKQRFMRLFPDPGTRIAFVRLVEEHEQPRAAAKGSAPKPAPTRKGPFGKQAQALRLHIDWMGNPDVWWAFGSDEAYSEWCRNQPCAHCKLAPHWEMDTFVKSENAHVRRIANGAGEAIKPPFSSIPMCHACHRAQHAHGESSLRARDWFDQMRIAHVHEWLWQQMKSLLGVASMSCLEPADLLSYAEANEIDRFLPECYRGAT